MITIGASAPIRSVWQRALENKRMINIHSARNSNYRTHDSRRAHHFGPIRLQCLPHHSRRSHRRTRRTDCLLCLLCPTPGHKQTFHTHPTIWNRERTQKSARHRGFSKRSPATFLIFYGDLQRSSPFTFAISQRAY